MQGRNSLCLAAADLYFKSYAMVARGNPNYFITYGNGKSGTLMSLLNRCQQRCLLVLSTVFALP